MFWKDILSAPQMLLAGLVWRLYCTWACIVFVSFWYLCLYYTWACIVLVSVLYLCLYCTCACIVLELVLYLCLYWANCVWKTGWGGAQRWQAGGETAQDADFVSVCSRVGEGWGLLGGAIEPQQWIIMTNQWLFLWWLSVHSVPQCAIGTRWVLA